MANPDSTLLSWITAEVNQALTVVREQIAKFAADPQNGALLQPCPGHVHQVSGALRMVGLAGATRFAEAIEAGFSAHAGHRPGSEALELLDRAVLALKEFMEGLERGQANVPLRLYPVYRELCALHGKREGSEKDLFFPDTSLGAPAHPDPEVLAKEEVAPCLLAQRGQFQRGLLAWLRNQPAGLQEMTQAVQRLHRLAQNLPEPRALWWAALGLLEVLRESTDPEWLGGARPLCNKIDFYLRDLAAGAGAGNDVLLREVLYAIAKSQATTPLAKEIRSFYQLDSLFPASPAPPQDERAGGVELNSEWLEAALYDAHSRLEALKSAWIHYISGEHKSAARLRELVSSFKAKAGELGNEHLIKLLDAISLVTKHLPDPYPHRDQYMVIEMASAFLLIENVIDHFGSPPADLEAQIVTLGGWVLDAAKGKSNGAPPAGLRADLLQEVGRLQLRTQVAKEISANLQHIEQVLDAFARDASKRDALGELDSYLRQVHGALKVLGFERAAEAMAMCENMVAACAAAELGAGGDKMDWIAEGLSSVALYLAPCLQGREPNDQALDLFFQRLRGRVEPLEGEGRADVTQNPQADEPKTRKLPAGRQNVDAELLGIFLEEAGEVLQVIDAALPLCREQPREAESLGTIRRAFHTLKGSGRMVGLMDLGEVAWEIEQLMNFWLEQKRPASAALLELLAQARQTFSAWVAKLREGNLEPEVEGATLVEAVRALKTAPAVAPAGLEDITIGSTTLTRAFFEIYIKEAVEHIATLEAEFAAWRAMNGADTSQSFMRAAHTLASSSGTAGFAELAALAGAIEQWIPFARQTKDPHDAQVLEAAIAKLRAMTDAMARREGPGIGAGEAARLKALTARLGSAPEVHAPARTHTRELEGRKPEPERKKRVLKDDIDEQLLPVFLEEAAELVPAVGADLRDWKANPDDAKISQSLRRALHTLKGSARMAGAIRLGELAHLMEDAIESAIEAKAYPPELFADLEEKMDRLSADVDRMRNAPATTQASEPALTQPAALLRVNADTLDHLINEAGEVSIARSRVEAELRLVRQSLNDLSESISRLRGQLREVEIQADSQMQSRLSVLEERKGDYDPLEFDRYTRLQELTRLMAESLNDVVSIQQALGKNLGETDAALLAQTRTTREVQQELMRMRAVPFSNLNERLYRVVRQSARELGKKADLEIEGAEVELDRSVLERIAAPLEHMLRNALAHGVEAPAARGAAGKPESGRISVALRQEANEILLTVTDDGAGIDLERLHQKAIDKGIVAADQALSEAERMQLVFASGLSTAESLTELAGRGVGMDVVRNEIAAIGGRIDIATNRGQGTSFTVSLPLTLAVTQAVLVRAGGSFFAISTGMVEQVLRLKSDAMAELYAKKRVEFQDRVYALHSLQHMLGGPVATELQNYNSVLLLRSGIQRIALHVDELVGNQEIVVKSLGPQLARMAWISGATVLADGSIVALVNPVVLARRAWTGMPDFEHTTLVPHLPGRGRRASNAAVIMVVDDSITVRKVTSRLLEREGYQVVTAKDGVEALQQLRDTLPALMLVDIEMPRMDGFDLARHLRAEARTRHIPIIVISSRTADKHRSQAEALGVNAFLGKPYQEAELLQRIGAFLGAAVQ